MDARLVAGPSEPEQTACEGDAPDDDRRKTPFGDGDVVVRREFSVVGGLGENNEYASQKHADDHAEVR